MQEIVRLCTAIMFLTRLPVGRFASGDPDVLSQSSRYFPLVGLIVGGLLCFAYLIFAYVFPTSVAIALLLLFSVLLTGAFHEDGLADVADSAGAFSLEKKLDIMRDSRVGTYGALALILLVLVKYVSLESLASADSHALLAAMLSAHVLSRWSSVYLMARVHYARAEADNKVVTEGVNSRRLIEATIIAALCLIVPSWLVGAGIFITLPFVFFLCLLAGSYFMSSFDGITGDCLGAFNQVVEVSVVLALVVWFA